LQVVGEIKGENNPLKLTKEFLPYSLGNYFEVSLKKNADLG